MKSTYSSNQLKLEMLNGLVDKLIEAQEAYNNIVSPIVETKVEIQFTPDTPENAVKLNQLHSQLSMFTKRLEGEDAKALKKKIDEISDQMESLELDIFHKSDRGTPSFLLKKSL